MKDIIRQVVERRDLSESEAAGAMEVIMSGMATDAQIAALLVALRLKGETVGEITGFARVMREKASKVDAGVDLTDTCGTGGDASLSFNISTTAAIVAAGMGVRIAKHGNRAVSSASGSADVLKGLGVNVDAGVETVTRSIREANFGFLFAPHLHLAMKYAIGPRREMGIRTVFNILGPLTNPAGASRQLLGVFSEDLTEPLARVLVNLGSTRAWVVHGQDGLDEITVTAETSISEAVDGAVRTFTLTPEQMGLKRWSLEDLQVSDAAAAARAVREVLEGAQGARRDIVLANAAAAAVVAGHAADIVEGVAAAAEAIDSGSASRALQKVVEITNAGT